MKIAILLTNMGGPDSLDAVEPYLVNIFSDPDIIDLPGPASWQKYFARWLAGKRVEKSRKIYRDIGGKSPLNDISKEQAERLQAQLNNQTAGTHRFDVFPAMRYWHPLIEDVWAKVLQNGYDQIIFLSMYPFYSSTTSGSLTNLVNQLLSQHAGELPEVRIIDRFGSHPLFIKAMAMQIRQALSENDIIGRTDVVLSAHSIPLKRIKKGDPYQNEIETALALLRAELPENIVLHLSYQSKIGPVKWLGPGTLDKVGELALQGIQILVVYPFGFVADNSETIQEIGIVIKKKAIESGISRYFRVDALNADKRFIDALTAIVAENLD